MKKRVLSLFMVLVLCLTLLPAPARAEEDTPEGGAIVQEEQQEEQEEAPAAESPAVSEQAAGAVAEVDGTTYSDLIAAFDEAQEKTSATVKLLADVATNGRTSSTHGDYGNGYYVFDQGNVTFDLNGHTLTWTKYDAYRTSLVVGKNGRLTVCDGGTDGKIYNENAQAINIYAGTLIIQSGTLMSESGKALKIDGGVVSITGGTIHSGDYFGEGVWINPDTVNNKTATLTISGDAKLIVSTSGTPADEATVTGTETWQFRFTVSIKPSIQLATDSVEQGGVAAVRVGQTLGQDAPAIKTTLKNVGFVKAGSGWICYLPIPWNQTPGSIDLEVSADGYTETLSLSVRAGSFSYKDYSKTSQMAAPYIGEEDAPAAVSKLFATVDDKIQWSVGGFVQPFLDSFDTPLTYGMTEYAGRSYSERGTNYGYGGRTSTNVIIRPKNSRGSMIAPASGRVLLAKDLGGLYGNTLVIEHGAGLKSIFYGLASLEVKTGDTVKQGQLLGGCSKAVVAEMRIGTVPIDPLAVWRSRCDGLKLY